MRENTYSGGATWPLQAAGSPPSPAAGPGIPPRRLCPGILIILLLNLALAPFTQADADRERPKLDERAKIVQDPLTVRALGKLEKRLEIEFNLPFPADFDTDAWRKRPMARMPVNGQKILTTRPVVNPYDEPPKVEWTVGPADPAKGKYDRLDEIIAGVRADLKARAGMIVVVQALNPIRTPSSFRGQSVKFRDAILRFREILGYDLPTRPGKCRPHGTRASTDYGAAGAAAVREDDAGRAVGGCGIRAGGVL
jgi:hypothetical protein